MTDPKTSPANVLEFKKGGGFLILFGLPFFLAGCLVFLAGLDLVPLESDQQAKYFMIPFGLVFALVGAAMMFGRAKVILDRDRGMAIRWRSFLVTLKREEFPLTFYDKVLIERRSDDNSESYPIVLHPSPVSGAPSMEIVVCNLAKEARARAEEIARFLNLPVGDRTMGREVTREADKLDETFKERLAREGAPRLAYAPPDMASKVRDQYGAVTIEIPRRTPSWLSWGPLLFVPVFVVVIARFSFSMLHDETMPLAIKIVGLGAIVIFFVILPLVLTLLYAGRGAGSAVVITASPSSLQVRTRGRVEEITADELEELVVQGAMTPDDLPRQNQRLPDGYDTGQEMGPAARAFVNFVSGLVGTGGIVARSDAKTIRVGRGLPEPELKYLHFLIVTALMEGGGQAGAEKTERIGIEGQG